LTLTRASLIVAAISVLSNRIFAVGGGLWLHVPMLWMLSLLVAVDILQIPFYFWLYENSQLFLSRLPARWGELFKRGPQQTAVGRWTASLGGLGVFLVAALPAMGGGMWTAIFLAYGLKLNRKLSYLWLVLGSAVSYIATYCVLDAVFAAVRDLMNYFGRV